MVSRPRGVSRVRGGFACRPLTLWRSEVTVLVVRRPSHVVARWSLVPATLAGEGLGSLSPELGVEQVAEAAMVPCAVNNSESECCELLYLSELEVVLCKFSGTYLTILFLLTLLGLRIRGWRHELQGP
ncbi:hypothetical protein Taro_031307 [Colocasia esculenta]|uniref:Uncharacterized protein n=1 Tax=Colocasia esculenta TaxID=4460 RepID=A0A843VRJ9_COLES|nr:hypothetical protein [Colocasia esculenta]